MSTPLPHDVPTPAQADLFERPLAQASEGRAAEVSTPVRADGWKSPTALPTACRPGHTAGYPHPYATTRPHTGAPTSPHARASRPSTYPKAYT